MYEPTLSEEYGIRYLHFGTQWVQGAMHVKKPNELILNYTRQMMSWLLLTETDESDHIALLGLGAGSLLRFANAYTKAQLETVEISPQVTAMCRAYFHIPESSRSKITHADAEEWVKSSHNLAKFKVMLIDLYDELAEGPVCDSIEFYTDCRAALSSEGIAVINLFGNHPSYLFNLANIRKAFNNRVLLLPQTPEGNQVVMALTDNSLQHTVASLLDAAHNIEKTHKMPAVKWARAILDQLNSINA